MNGSLIPPQVHTFCMETEETDIAYVASRLYYAAVAAGHEQATPDNVDRKKYEAIAKALIPTLSIRRPSPIAEGQVCKSLGSHPPAPEHESFKPAQYSDHPTLENPQEKNDAAATGQQNQQATTVVTPPPSPVASAKEDTKVTESSSTDTSHLD